MTTMLSFGFLCIGAKQELKFALKPYWKGDACRDEVKDLGGTDRPPNNQYNEYLN